MTIQIKPEHVGDIAWRIRFKRTDGRYMTFFVMVDAFGEVTHIPTSFDKFRYSKIDELRAEILRVDPDATFTDVTAFVDGLEKAAE